MNQRITKKTINVLALDLEATLISDVFSQIPRPGLRDFLEFCKPRFSRIVMFTGASEKWFREVANNLINSGDAPDWFDSLEYIAWDRDIKNLNFIPNASPENIILIDDYPLYIHPDQINNWIEIEPFEMPYPDNDQEFVRIQGILEKLLVSQC